MKCKTILLIFLIGSILCNFVFSKTVSENFGGPCGYSKKTRKIVERYLNRA